MKKLILPILFLLFTTSLYADKGIYIRKCLDSKAYYLAHSQEEVLYYLQSIPFTDVTIKYNEERETYTIRYTFKQCIPVCIERCD